MGSLFSFDFILDSRNISSLVALNAGCLSAVRSHVHSHVEVIYVLFVPTFNENRANLSSGDLQEVLMKIAASGLMREILQKKKKENEV